MVPEKDLENGMVSRKTWKRRRGVYLRSALELCYYFLRTVETYFLVLQCNIYNLYYIFLYLFIFVSYIYIFLFKLLLRIPTDHPLASPLEPCSLFFKRRIMSTSQPETHSENTFSFGEIVAVSFMIVLSL